MNEKTALTLARLARYCLRRAREYEKNGQDASAYRRTFRVLIQTLKAAISGEISSESLAELNGVLEKFTPHIVTKVKISAKPLDNSSNYGSIKLGNPHDDGGAGSGNWGHKGVPGQVGGSAPASGGNASSASGNSNASSASSSSAASGSSGTSSSTGNATGTTASPSPTASTSANSGNAPSSSATPSSSSSGVAQPSSPQDVRKELDARIASGAISTKLDAKKQSDHIVGSDRYNKRIAKGDHPSILDMPENDRQAFVDNYVKNGDAKLRKDGSIRIQFEHSSDVGTWVSQDGSQTAKTTRGTIHLSKTGAHIVPEKPKP